MLVVDLDENWLKFANLIAMKNVVKFFMYCIFLLRNSTFTIFSQQILDVKLLLVLIWIHH